ncbi:hypothetical protein F7725_013531 [Dissostichus mawsoni]|uniref:Cilia- and flagella-associated protein 206 n=1 Tax=Dissostichus mawsoni TaxID=36200 RepID=A0A7J5Y491_DISMA|nr:hypothetical protein F7725_013531 [Dissostichus mawsoni]
MLKDETLAWRYTSVLEKESDSQPAECDPPAVLLKQALYNVRQHEVFLKMLLDEAQLLNILRSILLSLQPFTASQAKIFSEACVDGLLEAAEVKTDQQRMAESAGYPHIGVFHHEEKLYVFSSKEAALKFASSPGDFIAEVAEKAKLSPELIQLLQLHRQFSCVSPYSEADLRTKETRSMQTDLSHMRRENVTQTWPPKDAATQSKRDGDSSVPRPQVYLAGLRGQRDAHVVKTNLTRPVDQ